jgi:hypothetical protein
VLLLGGFVFHLVWMVPVVGLLTAGGALIGPRGDAFEQIFAILLVPRLKPGPTVAAETVRDQDLALTTMCLLAALAFLVVASLGWLLAIVAAVIAIVAASTGVHLGEWAIHRLFSRDA